MGTRLGHLPENYDPVPRLDLLLDENRGNRSSMAEDLSRGRPDRRELHLQRAKGIELANGKPLAAFGELGLTGELRTVAHADRRIAEAAKFGLDGVVHPCNGTATLRDALKGAKRARAA